MGVLNVVNAGVLTGSEAKKTFLLTLKRIILQFQL